MLLTCSTAFGQDSTVAPAVPSPRAALDSPLPSQLPLPPNQEWCTSDIYCAGELLQTVNIAHLFPDDKTFVDKPTSKSSREILNEFRNISSGTTHGQVVNFIQQNFAAEGQELQALTLPNFNPNPSFLNNVTDTVVKGFAQAVHGFWTQLIRGTDSSKVCGSNNNCESTLIPLNHTFVVPGGRFREVYYWDSFWIVEGLIESELFDIVKDVLQNFMDQLDTIGFIPNGGRTYYLNRSQPPVFVQMLHRYVTATGDRAILERGLPLAEKELRWWSDERSLEVRSPFTNETHKVYHYAVKNSAPRPESYLTDYKTATDPNLPLLNDTQKADLYAELASGAESGWDYTSRWFADDAVGTSLRNLQVRNTVAVDLNAILYGAHIALRDLYSASSPRREYHDEEASDLREAILDLHWDSAKLAFYDFNVGTNTRNKMFTAANFYPYWVGIYPDEVLASEQGAFGAFSSINLVMNRYNGTLPATFVDTHEQWDAPNAWPPHQYIALQALRHLPANVTRGPIPTRPDGQSTFALVPPGQLGLSETELPGQPIAHGQNATTSGPQADVNLSNGAIFNGGTGPADEGWASALGRQLANRYYASALCSWHATGGAIPGILPRLTDAELNVTQSISSSGHMFEKFSNLDIDSAGRGGEYVVQAGFGWTNGVLLWIASNYGSALAAPQCPRLEVQAVSNQNSGVRGAHTSALAISLLLAAAFQVLVN